MMTDIEIAQSTPLCPIAEIAEKAGIPAEAAEPYGSNKAKITEDFLRQQEGRPRGKLILVTAVNPTPAGEGKTTTSIGLAQALCRMGEKAIVTLREPSLGPVFGLKGGAAGGGYSQVLPMEEINLHFTGDIHAVTAANNLLSALIDNHIHQGNALNIDPERVVFRRCMDMNDRSLRKIEIGLGGKANGTPRMDGFQISVASEVMAILCLAKDLRDLRERLGRILIGYDTAGKAVFARDLQAEGAMAALLREALRPNLVQTLEHTPCLMHGGPFANIAHGCNSVRATRLALTLADYTVTEAGFGSDLGAEKFFDIKCPAAGLEPSAAVPNTQTPLSFSSAMAVLILVTRATFMYSTAPAEALATEAVRPTLRRLGMMTPCAPAHSAVRMMAPRLCGSLISSHTTSRGASPRSRAAERMSSTLAYSRTAARAMTPWCAFVALM